MKKFFYLMAASLMVVFAASCEKEPSTGNGGSDEVALLNVNVKVALAEANEDLTVADLKVTMAKGETIFEANTDKDGKVSFQVPSGVYDITCSSKQLIGRNIFNLNGLLPKLVVTNEASHAWNEEAIVDLKLVASKSSQVIIKEIYTGGCMNPATQDDEAWDKYITLYNNSPYQVTLKNFCIGNTQGNSYAGFIGYLDGEGKLTYEKEDWIPNTQAVVYFQKDLTIEPYTDVVVVLCGAIDHTQTNSNSVDLSHADYVLYDPEAGFNHKYYHPTPSENIPTDHYLKAVNYGFGNSWVFSMSTPAFFLYSTEGMTPQEYAANEDINCYPPKFPNNKAFISKKLSRAWIYDGVDTMSMDFDDNYKRMTPDIDAGFVYTTTSKGYSMYRNVDVAATMSIEGNKEKLVMGYAMGTESIEKGSTDPSGIDAEASIKNGAKIVYMDTNNSTNDFHLRKQAAQRK